MTIGEHLKKRRLKAGLFQKDVAAQLGTSVETLINWEQGRTPPADRFWAAILDFLGYDPRPEPETLGSRLIARRQELGLCRKKAAKLLGIDETTLWRWESGQRNPNGSRCCEIVNTFLTERS